MSTSSSSTEAILFTRLPIELGIRIFVEGSRDSRFGAAFGAKCMRLARWVQPIIAPILYSSIVLGSDAQAQSLLLAIYADERRKTYVVRKLIQSIEIVQDLSERGKNEIVQMAEHIAELIIWLNKPQSSLTSLKIPLAVMDYPVSSGLPYPKLPPSITFTGPGTLFSDYNFSSVTHIRLSEINLPLWQLKALFSIARSLTHIALKVSRKGYDGLVLVESLLSVKRLKCAVIAVDLPERDPHREQLFNLKHLPHSHSRSIKDSNIVVWVWDVQVRRLFKRAPEQLFWEKAEGELRDRAQNRCP
ncbi:hypothetical protein CPB86DRAFT_740340 [Serendipita vermifera]|nr:hypothetical protein CPB86DRAFT_740340 [Serendipita vermifera]